MKSVVPAQTESEPQDRALWAKKQAFVVSGVYNKIPIDEMVEVEDVDEDESTVMIDTPQEQALSSANSRV